MLFENGLPHDDAAPEAANHLQGTDVRINVDLGTGGGGAATDLDVRSRAPSTSGSTASIGRRAVP